MDQGYLEREDYYLIRGFASLDAANEGRRSVNNAARHLGISCSSRESVDVFPAGNGTYTVRFRIWPKDGGRAHVHQATGGDPANLAYNPFRRAKRA